MKLQILIPMKLFDPVDPTHNVLPFDGKAYYHGILYPEEKSTLLFKQLREEIDWKNDEVLIFGKHIKTKRKVAWFGDQNYRYSYSGTTKQALPWTNTLLEIKQTVEQETGETFNSCLANLYHDGSEGMGWHRDNEKYLVKNGSIASVSLGACRKFVFKHIKNSTKVSLELEHGSLLVMKSQTQDFWLHSVPKATKKVSPRINLTFRNIIHHFS